MNDRSSRLRSAGLRVTRQRADILETVERLRHATPERILEELADTGIDQSTVYRCLDALAQAGLVTHTHIGHGPPVYHAVDPTPHLHLVCQKCGWQGSADIAAVAALSTDLLAEHGFTADLDYATIPGTCRRCALESGGGGVR